MATKVANIETTNARVQTRVTDTTPTVPLPDTPQGLMVVGPQVTLKFIHGEWSSANSYDYYDVVQVDGTSYIAVQDVPANTEITDTEYWAKWNDPNAQVELLQNTVAMFEGRLDTAENEIDEKAPIMHTSTDGTYGVGSDSYFGHVKIGSNYESGGNQNTALSTQGAVEMYNKLNNVVESVSNIKSPNFLTCDTVDGFIVLGYLDGRNHTHIKRVGALQTGDDFTSFFKYGDFYYIMSNKTYWWTKDFITFKNASHGIVSQFNGSPWGITYVENTTALIAGLGYKQGTFTNWAGDTTYYIRPNVVGFTQQEDGSLTFQTPRVLNTTGFNDGDSYIDPNCIRLRDGSYVVVFKNEKTDDMVVYTAETRNFINTGLTNKLNYNVPIKGWEGAKLIETQDGVVNALVNMYDYKAYIEHVLFKDMATAYPRCNTGLAIFTNIIGGYDSIANVIYTDSKSRHVSIIPMDALISNNIHVFSLPQQWCFNTISVSLKTNASGTINTPLLSGMQIALSGSSNVTINSTTNTNNGVMVDDGINHVLVISNTAMSAAGIRFTGNHIPSDFDGENLHNSTTSYVPRTFTTGEAALIILERGNYTVRFVM